MRLLPWIILAVSTSMASADSSTALDVLVAAYPDHLAGHSGNDLIWKDGTHMAISDGIQKKTFQQMLDNPDIDDQFAIKYPLGSTTRQPGTDEDPGRIRFEPFFSKMYGDCRKGETKASSKKIGWPSPSRQTLTVTTVNGVADRLVQIARELQALPVKLQKYIFPSSGVFNCRPIAGTHRLSMHSYAAAIDLNAQYGDYWRWAGGAEDGIRWKNRIPPEIVDVFERHGFVWGGKWYHFDTMHFEYRPEIIELARRGWPK